MANFLFDPEIFVDKGRGLDPGEWSQQDRSDIAQLRESHPELSHWGDLAIGSAFSGFSNAVLDVAWGNWMIGERSEDFLTYCCWRQLKGHWNFGMFFKVPNREVLPIWKGLNQ